jgi:uncharacterized protein YqjF (DUF2071 family)
MPSIAPKRRVHVPMVGQRWRQVAFVHWPLEVEAIASLVPPPLEIDTFDGAAWLTLTPFSTTCEVLGKVRVPGPARFPETNVRTYVRGPDGGDGLWFFSLAVTNRANAVLGRSMGLPYHLGDMSLADEMTTWCYTGNRLDASRSGRYELVLGNLGDDARSPLDVFLTGRWSAYVVLGPVLYRCDVEHEPWPLRHASLTRSSGELLAASGLPVPSTEPVVHAASGVDARLSVPLPLSF